MSEKETLEKLIDALAKQRDEARADAQSAKDIATEYGMKLDDAIRQRDQVLTALKTITAAASGLSHGRDWNHGTHALTHGYRQKLIDAIPIAEAAIAAVKGEKQ